MRVGWFFVLTPVWGLAGCGDDPALLVDLRTDYRPGLELAAVETRLLRGETTDALVEAPADPARDYRAGVRVAELAPPEGTVRVEVRLYANNGDLLGRRRVVTNVEGTTGVMVVIGRDCSDVTCDAETSECLNGVCVADTCDPVRNPGACGEALCTVAADCAIEGLADCATVECIDAACLSSSDDASCAPSDYCDADDGCVERPTSMDGGIDSGRTDAGADAGATDASTDAACDASAPCDTGRACEEGAIDCSGGSPVCVATGPKPAGRACRAAATECDAAEACDGTATECPMDAFEPVGTPCVAGSCDGLGACMSGCTPGTECGTGNPCQLGEVSCTTGSPVCVGVGPASAGTLCRSESGACDVAETCDGTSTVCPGDGYLGASTVCRPSAGACDVEERCDSTDPGCPADARVGAGTECRVATGLCDVAESCDGTSVACPPDGVASGGTVCRAAAGDCDVTETCDGATKPCPTNGYAPSSTVCRASAGVCDVAESCTGSSASCPADGVSPNGTSCSDGLFCDGAETCQSGVCTAGGDPCTQPCDCIVSTCNEGTDTCDWSTAPDFTACSEVPNGRCYGGQCYDCSPCILSDCDAGGGAPGCNVGSCAACISGGLCPI